MADTPNLELPIIEAAQAQKHVTHNEALRALDAIVQLGVVTAGLTAPPADPDEGSRYIVATSATGVWAGKDGVIAAYQDGAWAFHTPKVGWLAWVGDEEEIHVFDGADWIAYASGLTSVNPVPLAGVNTTADATNRLAVKSNAVLFSHDDVTPGDGSIRHKINKATADRTATVVFQDNWSGRAEIGLAGDDDLHFKVSADGGTWKEGLRLDRTTGAAAFPSGTRHAPTGASTNMLVQTPGGTGVTTIWRFDAAHVGIPRFATIASVSGDCITLTEARAREFFNNDYMEHVSYVHVWNTSKSPEQSAWLRAGAATSTTASSNLYVTNAADIAGWSSTDQLRLGEPIGAFGGVINNTNVAAIDISPMMQRFFTTAFRQSGLLIAMTISTNGSSGGWYGQVAVSPDATAGSFGVTYTPNDGSVMQGTAVIGATVASPISNSNLLFVRELDNGSGTLLVSMLAVKGIYV